ncbi:MAG: glycosyltransferase 87 family protein [Jatrophihabitantaceae bacterium]
MTDPGLAEPLSSSARSNYVAAARRVMSLPLADEALVFALALAARLYVVLGSGGLLGNYGYDASVYYAAGDGLAHGRLPYRDFVFLHPPGIVVVLAPFAWLGRLTSDHTGFVTASLAFTVLGALNAVLVVLVAKRMGVQRRGTLLGGVFYALWLGAVGAEFLTRLEPLGNFFVLCGLLAFLTARTSSNRYLALVTGAAFATAASVKIWWAVLLLVVLAWHVVARRPRRELVLAVGGAAATLLVLDGPFFLLAPSQMWHMVVTEQLGRYPDQTTTATRLLQLSTFNRLVPQPPHAVVLLVAAAFVLVVLALVATAWSNRSARLVAALSVIQVVVLVVAPSWFTFYPDYLAPALALTVAAALGPARTRTALAARLSRWAWLPVAYASAVAVLVFAVHQGDSVRAFPGARLARAVAQQRCVMSDSPMALIELDVLSRDFANGCRNWVDVTGRTYGPDAAPLDAAGVPVGRPENQKWQRDLRAYLLSGNAVIIIRADGTGPSAATWATVRRGGVLAAADGYVVYRTN